MSYRLACSPILWRPFLNWGSLQSEAINLCQIDRKLPSTVSNGLLPITPCSLPQMEYLESLWTVYFLVFLQPDYIILYLEPISKTGNFFETGYDVVQASLKLVSSSDWLQNSDSCLHLLCAEVTSMHHHTYYMQLWGSNPRLCVSPVNILLPGLATSTCKTNGYG